MGLYFYAMVPTENPEGDDIEFHEDEDGYSKLYEALVNNYPQLDGSKYIYMKDVSNHGVFIRPRDVDIDVGFYAGDAGCFIEPSLLRAYTDNEYELNILDKYIEMNALMFPL